MLALPAATAARKEMAKFFFKSNLPAFCIIQELKNRRMLYKSGRQAVQSRG